MKTPPTTDHWKVRITIGGGVIYCASITEPTVKLDKLGRVKSLEWSPILGTEDGDTIGFIDWDKVAALTWRLSKAPETKEEKVNLPPSMKPEDVLTLFDDCDFMTYKHLYDTLLKVGKFNGSEAKRIISDLTMSRHLVRRENGLYHNPAKTAQ